MNTIDLVKSRALERSAAFVERNGRDAVLFGRKEKLWDFIAPKIPADGLMMECGVWKGRSINHMAALHPARTLFGFDSFQGLAEDWAGVNHAAGHFDLGGVLPEVTPNVTLTKGWVEDTLPAVPRAQNPGPIAYLHVDTDTYSPAVTILNLTAARVIPGSIVLFDELIGYPNWENGEFRALAECWPEDCYRFIGFSQMQAALVIERTPAS